MGKPKAPKAPDYVGAAKEQGAANLNATLGTNYLNQISQVGPEGSMTYNYDTANGHRLPDGTVIPKTTVTTQLSPEQQKLYDQNNQISTALNDLASRGIGYVDQASASPVSIGGPEVQYGPQTGRAQQSVFGAPIQGNFRQQGPLTESTDQTDFQRQYGFDQASRLPTMDDFASQRDQVVEALMSRQRPDMDYNRDRMENRLSNQGLAPGSEAYNREMDLLGRQENDARMSAILAGSGEQGRLFQQAMASRQQGVGEAQAQGDLFNRTGEASFGQGMANANLLNTARGQQFGQDLGAMQARNMAQEQGFQQDFQRANLFNQGEESLFNRGLASSQFSNQARQQALQEADYFKNQPLNMLNALRTGNQVSMPQFQNVATGAQMQAAPVYQATADAGDYAMKQYQERMKSFGSMLSGLGSLGSAAITKFSDRRLKTRIRKIGEQFGLGVYSFRYQWGNRDEIGFMADEVAVKFPAAIIDLNGYKAVNYAMVG